MSSSPVRLLALLSLGACDHPADAPAPAAEAIRGGGGPALLSRVAAQARAFRPAGDGTLAAVLPSALRAELSASGAVVSRPGRGALHVRATGFGRGGAWTDLSATPPALGACADGTPSAEGCVRRAEFAHAGLTEWWVARPDGMQQGWTLTERPGGSGALVVDVRFIGAEVWADGEDISVVTETGDTWRYGGLFAWDASGDPLSARLEADGERVHVIVDDAGADYPITIDPLLETEDVKLTASDASSSDRLGYAVSGAGDVNGDGYADVIVGAYYNSIYTGSYTYYSGAAYLYYGTSTGIDSSTEDQLLPSDRASYDYFGWDVSGAGDVDGDGYDDVIVGAYRNDDGATDAGSAYVFYGASTGIGGQDKLIASDGASYDYFGLSVSGAGDVDGDGYDDVIVGAYGDDDRGSGAGSAYVYYGASSGIDSSTEEKLLPTSLSSSDSFGYSVSGAGDVDGDGYDDVIVGAYGYDNRTTNDGVAFIHYGSASGTSGSTRVSAADYASSDYFGRSVAGAGDVNGDGYDDVVVGAYLNDDRGSSSGSAYVHYGSAGGISGTSSQDKLVASDGASSDYFGYSVAGVGDIDSDGYDDVIVGAPYDDDGGSSAGSAYVYYGTSTGVAGDSEEKVVASDGGSSDYFGLSVSGAGDVDGNGTDDLLIGAYGDDDGGSDAGAAYVFISRPDADGDGLHDLIDCDDADASVGGKTTFYEDGDDDGYGDPDSTTDACEAPSGYVGNDDDCDDTDAATSPDASDTCGDGVDSDCDGVGGRDGDEDSDGLTWREEDRLGGDDCDEDTDGDGLIDGDEVDIYGTDLDDTDSDGDGLDDGDEVYTHGTDPSSADTDGDGLDDGDEISTHGTDPSSADTDSDNLSDGDEVNTHGTDPDDSDSDNDGLSDGAEVNTYRSDPNDTDTDGDGLDDGDEVFEHGSDPTRADTDGDGLDDDDEVNTHGTDPSDPDTDGDGLDDGDEVSTHGTDPDDRDSDNDGLDDGAEVNVHGTDPNDTDTDGDGLSDAAEVEVHSTDPAQADSDGDGLSDGDEVNTYQTDPNVTDSDSDGLSDGAEADTHGTDPNNNDTDGDGLRDGAEVSTHGTDPRDPDTDDDTLSDGDEVNTHGTDPDDIDTDDDGLDDATELEVTATDPNDADSDGDGLSDGDEVNLTATDPNDADSDGDGLSDGDEVNTHGSDPNRVDTDGDSIDDGTEVSAYGSDPTRADSDSDGLDDYDEVVAGSDPTVADSDGDGLSDGDEVNTHGTDPTEADSDGDGLSDGDEVNTHGTDPTSADTDSDGLSDSEEVSVGADPNNDDTDGDGVLDGADPTPTGGGDDAGKDGEGGCATARAGTSLGWLALLGGVTVLRRRRR